MIACPVQLAVVPDSQIRARLTPEQRLCEVLIVSAIRDATHLRKGRPTWISRLAKNWLMEEPDPSDREAFLGSFCWCCHWLGYDPVMLRIVLRKYVTAKTSLVKA